MIIRKSDFEHLKASKSISDLAVRLLSVQEFNYCEKGFRAPCPEAQKQMDEREKIDFPRVKCVHAKYSCAAADPEQQYMRGICPFDQVGL